MGFLRSRFTQAVGIFVLAFVVLRFGIRPPAPWSVLRLYMTIIAMALLVFVSSDRDSWRDFVRPIRLTLTDPRYRILRTALVIVIPLLLGYYAYTQAAARPQAPPELRAVHPAPPDSLQFRGKEINISGVENPLRKDTANYAKHVAAGRDTYVRNCVYCHGDNLDGQGHFAYGFNPPPANFQDKGTIAMLQEAYLFWRIAKGGPGLPKESAPWNSVMPRWEERLTEEQIWQVIMFLYDFTEQKPRRWETSEHAAH
jgi:mono/diheme cytochrome c family protein